MKSKSIKLLSFLLATLMILSTLVACNTGTPNAGETTTTTTPSTSVTDQLTLPSTESITLPYTEPTTLPLTDVTTPSTEIITSVPTETVTTPVIETVTTPVTEPVTSPVTEIITTPVTETVTSPVTEIITIPVTETITTPVTEIITTPITETVTLPSTEIITLPPIETVTMPLPEIPTDTISDSFIATDTDINTDIVTSTDIESSTDTIIDTESAISTETESESITLPTTDSFTESVTDLSTETLTDIATDSNTDTTTESTTVLESDSATSESETIAGVVPETESSASSETATEGSTETTTPDVEIDESILTVFANGAYTVEFIRGDLANQLDKNTYNEIRNLFKEKTTKSPALKTDFVGVGKEPYSGPAILIGETSFQESIDVYKTLKDNQAVAKLVGNKYVIAFSNTDSANKIISTIKGYLKKQSESEIKIDENWNATLKVTTSFTENENFKDSGLTKEASLNNIGLGTQYDAGQGCKTYIKTNVTSKTVFTDLCTKVEKAGATKYTGNSIGNNLFATYVTQTQIIHLMYFPNIKEIRTAVDKRGTGTSGFSLPGLSTENKYTKKGNSSLTLCEIENSDWPGGLCMIFKLADGRFFVVDSGVGGRKDNGGSSCGWVYASLAKHADDPKNIKVAAWLITHVHSDHAGGLVDMARGWYQKNGSDTKHKVMPQECTKYIKIEKLIYNAPGKLPDSDRDGWMNEIITAFNIQKVIKAHPGQVFHLSDLTLTIFASLDLVVEQKVGDTNEHSVVSRATFNGKTVLMLGDTFPKINKQLANIYQEQLKSDVLQVAHHGYNNTDATAVNKYCNPSIVLYPVSTGDMRRENVLNVAVNAPLKGKTSYAPHGGNVFLDHNWKKSMISNSTILNMIPTCPCCGKRSSYSPKYDSKCPCGCQN